MEILDLGPATTDLARIVASVRDDQLGGPTPCPAYTVGDLLDHVGGLSLAFAAAARKSALGGAPSADAAMLPADWREVFGERLADLADAWREPGALDGTTMAGPVEMPAAAAQLVAVDEVVVHAWDLAIATGQPYDPDPAAAQAALGFATSFEPPPDAGGGLFGPPVPVPADAPLLHRLLGATGRDAAWRP